MLNLAEILTILMRRRNMTDSKDLSEPLLSGFEEKVEDEDWRASLVAVEVTTFSFRAPYTHTQITSTTDER